MFKTAATKIAHNSTLPALGGNQELRHLQDLITAEKSVLIALQKLSVDYSKASEALRTWGLNEGDDLGDILSACTTILNHFSSALSQYASHGHVMRDQLKAIRSREEALEELKRRRRTVVRKAEDADKKLSRMSPEHKNLAMQTETLNRLRDEIRNMDSDIMTEEAALGDFKRSSTRMWMGLKFGGLLEMCEKGTIVAEFGKMLIGEISEEITQPGLPRSLYYGHSKTENYVAEAHRCINEVVLSTVPSVGFRDRQQYELRAQEPSGYQPAGDGYPMSSGPWTPTDVKPQPQPPMRTSNDYPQRRSFGGDSAPSSPLAATGSSFQNQPNQFQPQHPYGPRPEQQQTMDDFGVNTRSAALVDNSNTAGGRFATFPVKRPGGYSLQDPPLLGPRPDQESSFSDSIAAALDGRTEETSHATEGTHSQAGTWNGSRFMPGPPSSYGTEETTRAVEGPPSVIGQQQQQSQGTPQQPSYDATSSSPPHIGPPTPQRQFSSGSSPLPPPPPGAAPPDLGDPWANANRDGGSLQAASHTRNISDISGNDNLLAYMTTPQSEPPSPLTSAHATHALAAANEEEQQRISRHVRFGEIKDDADDGEMEKRESLEKEKVGPVQESNAVEVPSGSPPEYTQTPVDTEKPSIQSPENTREVPGPLSPTGSSGSDTTKTKLHRIPPPTLKSEEEEKALNVAAARQVSLELEALKNSPPKPEEITQPSQTEPVDDRGRPPMISRGYSEQLSDNSSLPPPSAPFAKRNASPHPYAELNDNASPQYSGQYTSAQLYAQSYQSTSPYGAGQPSSPAQAYAQTYQNSHADLHSTSNIPPRFQALNQEIQVPPRFQGARSHSPGSPTASQLPPRFQTGGGAAQIPPNIALPETESRFGQSKGPDTPYRTPPEYPRGNSSYTRSTSSLNNSSSPVTTSAPRTISAAAFKRPRNTSVDNLGVQSDYFTKKTLPSSPYPVRDPPAPVAPATPDRTAGVANNASANSLPPGAGPPTGARKSILDDDEYDYISAYVNNSNPNSPKQPEFGHNSQDMVGVGAGTNTAGRGAGGGGGGGYDDGRFATDLDNGSLR